MEYQKITRLLDDSSNKISKFRTRNWVEINDESRGKYNDEKQIIFKTTMLKSILCDYSDPYILVKGKIIITGAAADAAARQADERDKGVAFKNCAPFTSCKSDINNVEITGKTPTDGNEKVVQIMVPLKYLSNFWRTLEMPLINCEISLVLTW